MINPFELIDRRLLRIERLLRDIQTMREATPHVEAEQWFGIDQLCLYHPDKPKRSTVYSWVQSDSVPYHKTGKKLRFLKSEIDAWLKSQRRKTVADLDQEAAEYQASKLQSLKQTR